jgi:ferric-dicitrate binding protein FerR (iron transport regulator)
MSEEPDAEFHELVAACIEGTLNREGMLRLREICRADATRKDQFERQVQVHRLLDVALEKPASQLFSSEVIERIRHQESEGFLGPVIERVSRISRRRTWLRWTGTFAAAAALVMAAMWWNSVHEIQATLHRGDTAKWAGKEPPSELRTGSRLKLESGLAEVHFKNGVEVILEGPAEFEIRRDGNAWLERGRVMARVPERAIGFTLETPRGKVIDLGTSFGTSVTDSGETETQVFEGKVRVHPVGESDGMIIHENEKWAVGDKGAVKSTGVADSGFVTSLPPQSGNNISFIHWPMDEGTGLEVGAKLPGGVSDPVPAHLRTFKIETGYPQWINGPFGSALSFNGDGHALETYHQGPRHGTARTIAFWVRVPVDFHPAQGLGIISWGKLREWGTAWQISISPYGNEGDLGRLRVGTGKSGVVGVTDLRDGAWHHCAVVLYEDPEKADRFPVLLYVDGKMEAASTKAVYGVNTDVSEDARLIWLGRSLGHGWDARPPQGTGFFRGDLDEVYVFEGALNRKQIDHLMVRNQAPGK